MTTGLIPMKGASALVPDVIVMDLAMPQYDGLTANSSRATR
jgi:CheY-like chemotaxis protein